MITHIHTVNINTTVLLLWKTTTNQIASKIHNVHQVTPISNCESIYIFVSDCKPHHKAAYQIENDWQVHKLRASSFDIVRTHSVNATLC